MQTIEIANLVFFYWFKNNWVKIVFEIFNFNSIHIIYLIPTVHSFKILNKNDVIQ